MASEYDTALRAKGFYCYERCKCYGVFTEKYKPKNPALCMDIRIFTAHRNFIIYKNFDRVAKGKLTVFTTTLNSLC